MRFVDTYHRNKMLKICNRIDSEESDEFLQFLKQMGVDSCYAWVKPGQDDYDFLARLNERVEKHGLYLHNLGSLQYFRSKAYQRALPDRDKDIEAFIKLVKIIGRIGVPTTTMTWESDHAYATSPKGHVVKPPEDGYQVTTRGGAPTRLYDDSANRADPASATISVTREQAWENFEYFAKATVPVAEESKVRICLHPNDPPVDYTLGVSTLIQSIHDYRRAFEITDSEFFGMEFCCGCWLEGGSRFGDIIAGIKEFVKAGKISIVHFRNVSGTLPYFIETFIDDGYQDMYRLMKTFVEAGYNGSMIYDHSPNMTTGLAAQTAFAVGYMKGLRKAAQDELGVQ